MKPGFALSLSFEGISLLQRAAGGWRSVGDVSLEAADLAAELAVLRDKARAFGASEFQCKIIIPNDQIRYLSVETGTFSGAARQALIRKALDGATPYAVDDLAFDLSLDGSTTHVAAVARETLAEAESFAVEHGFNPVSFVATPDDNAFLGEPFFGPAAHATLHRDAPKVEPDGIAVVVIGPAEAPDAAPIDEPVVAPESVAQTDPPDQPKIPQPQVDSPTSPDSTGFSSRRKPKTAEIPAEISPGPDNGAPALGGANRDETSPEGEEPAPVAFRSANSPLAEEATPSPEVVSVTSPTLDIPDNDAEPETTGFGGFLSRRKKADRSEPPVAAPFVPPAPAPIRDSDPFAQPDLTAVSRPSDPGYAGAAGIAPPKDETERMTVFGARDQANVGGKPRHLGLILSAALLVFLAAVAAWASIFLDDGLAGLFRTSPAKTELAAVTTVTAVPGTPKIGDTVQDQPQATTSPPVPEVSEPENTTTLAMLPPATLDVPSLPAPRRITQPDLPVSPDLSDTDSAVLDALRQPEQPEEQAAVPELEPAQEATTEPEPVNEPETDTTSAPDTPVALAATDILKNAPQVPDTPSIIGLDDLYVASIDRTDLSQDAVALPTIASLNTDLPFGSVSSPVAAGTEFTLGPDGLVKATVEGTLNPGGVLIYLGRPAAVPPARPARLEPSAEEIAAPDRLAGRRPRLRPNDLSESFERGNLGGLTRVELKRRRPKARPASLQEQAEPQAPPTAQAVVSSRVPHARPGNFAAIVSAAIRPEKPDSSAGATASASAAIPTVVEKPRSASPRIPSSASVARQATLRNEINLRRVNLIGVYGTPSNRRALVRLPSGRYKKVKVGDTVDGGRVVAIGDSELRYQKSGRNLTLKIPSS